VGHAFEPSRTSQIDFHPRKEQQFSSNFFDLNRRWFLDLTHFKLPMPSNSFTINLVHDPSFGLNEDPKHYNPAALGRQNISCIFLPVSVLLATSCSRTGITFAVWRVKHLRLVLS
jgi:hypothetical protein